MANDVAPAWISPDSVVAMTQALVATDTRNPPGQERLAADVARQLLEPLGCTFDEIEPEPGRVSLVARLGDGAPDRPVLIVNGHLDVVPINPAGWSHEPFGGEIDAGRVWGRGTADMKGGIAAAIEAVLGLGRAGREIPCDIVFPLIGDACLVPEPTSLGICIAERGILTAEVILHGRPAHASEPHRGISAIEKAAKVILALHGVDFHLGPHSLLGSPTANAGVIAGGSGPNTVAEHCLLTVDHRTLPGQDVGSALDDLRRLIDQIDDPDLRYELSAVVFGEASEMPADHPWIDVVQAAMVTVTGRQAPVIGMPFATDARFVRNQAAIPAVVCGPGGLEEAHIDDEFVGVDALVEASTIYAELIAAFDQDTVAALRARPLPAA
ncbi:MAG: M20 family metallopeptidase [Acidimicrobiales bacterium]